KSGDEIPDSGAQQDRSVDDGEDLLRERVAACPENCEQQRKASEEDEKTAEEARGARGAENALFERIVRRISRTEFHGLRRWRLRRRLRKNRVKSMLISGCVDHVERLAQKLGESSERQRENCKDRDQTDRGRHVACVAEARE